jgi:hypothetical protein
MVNRFLRAFAVDEVYIAINCHLMRGLSAQADVRASTQIPRQERRSFRMEHVSPTRTPACLEIAPITVPESLKMSRAWQLLGARFRTSPYSHPPVTTRRVVRGAESRFH